VAVLDEGISNKLSASINKKVYVLPDVTNEIVEQNEKIKSNILNKAKGRKVIGLLGSLSGYKGLLSFTNVIKMADSNLYFFIIAGKLSMRGLDEKKIEMINYFFKKTPSNCFFILKRIKNEKDFNTLINSCDILLAVYENFPHSSNILTKAALLNKFVIVSDKYLIAERVEKFQLGLCVEQENSSELLKAIESLSQKQNFYGVKLKPKFKEYFLEHSQKKLLQILSKMGR
jgi:hypothetical protein